MTRSSSTNKELTDALFRVKRGLCAYISYLAACEMNEAFSEYVLYEPILRILNACGYTVQCEYECPGLKHAIRGDKKRLDFYAQSDAARFALEVKWTKSSKPQLKRDVEKLEAFGASMPGALPLLCVFGRKSHIEVLDLQDARFKERGKAVYADLRRTQYACRIYEFRVNQQTQRRRETGKT